MPLWILCMVLFAALAEVGRADWAHYQGPNYNGISAEKDLSCSKLPILWEAQVNIGFAGITVADGRVFTMGNKDDQDFVYALDEKTGELLWSYSYAQKRKPNLYEGGPNASPTIDKGRVYILSKQGKILCLDATDGSLVWESNASTFDSKAPSWGFSSSPTVVGDAVIFNVGPAGLALEKATGKKIWASGPGTAGYSPAIPYTSGKKERLMLISGKEIMSLDTASGQKQWAVPFEVSYDVNAASPLIFGQRVFVSAGYKKGGGVYDFSSGKAKEVWFQRHLKTQFSTALVLAGHVYGVDGNSNQRAKMVCVDLATGELKWKVPSKFGSVRYADEKLFFLEDKGDLVVASLSPEGMQEIKRKKLFDDKCWTAPTIANGKLFARTANGSMACVDLR